MSSKSSYELLVQSLVDYAIYMLDLEGYVVSWSPAAERIAGYTSEEIIGEHFSRFCTEEERSAGLPNEALRIAAQTGRFAGEAWRLRKDGSRFWAMVAIDPIYQEGRLIGFAEITRDLSDQHGAQIATLESERRFRLLVQSVTDYAIFMLDPDGYVTNWNTGAERIKGYTASEIVGQHFSRFYTPEDVAQGVPRQALEIARQEGRYEAEGWRCRKDGTRFWANVVIDAIRHEGALVGFAKITRDLTERREAQLKLEQSREELFQSQKMEAVGQLTSGLAHDFNNMLTGICGSLDMLQRRIDQGRLSGLEHYITTAQEAAFRAASLTHRLLAFSRRRSLDPRPIDPNGLISTMEELIRRTVGPGVRLESMLAADVWTTLCDPNQLENAILNLCINARDAMPGGGRLTIQTVNISLDEPAARERDVQPGEYVVVCVTDTGAGMAPEVISRAFEPFFTTKPVGQGTGLGLSMTYGFARQSGGQVRIESKLGAGTTIHLYLPRHLGVAIKTRNVARLPAGAHQAPAGDMVLVVDDEPAVRMLVVDVLEQLGYAAVEAADGASGLKVLRSMARIDLLIADIGLPGGLNGRQLADAARQLRPTLPVLLITGYAANTAMGGDPLEPGMELLTKPFAMDVLADRVKAITA